VRLLDAVRRRGGVKTLGSPNLGLRYTPRGRQRPHRIRRPHQILGHDRIASAISPLIEELGAGPTKGEFRAAGLSKALAAVYEPRRQRPMAAALRRRSARTSTAGARPPALDSKRWKPNSVNSVPGRERGLHSGSSRAADRYALYEQLAGMGMKHWREVASRSGQALSGERANHRHRCSRVARCRPTCDGFSYSVARQHAVLAGDHSVSRTALPGLMASFANCRIFREGAAERVADPA